MGWTPEVAMKAVAATLGGLSATILFKLLREYGIAWYSVLVHRIKKIKVA